MLSPDWLEMFLCVSHWLEVVMVPKLVGVVDMPSMIWEESQGDVYRKHSIFVIFHGFCTKLRIDLANST